MIKLRVVKQKTNTKYPSVFKVNFLEKSSELQFNKKNVTYKTERNI